MNNYYWTVENWGDEYPPENAERIAEYANELIDDFIDENPGADDDAISNYSARLWDRYCCGDLEKEIINYEYAVSLMDYDIREAVYRDISPCSRARFLAEYEKRHLEKYGEEFQTP